MKGSPFKELLCCFDSHGDARGVIGRGCAINQDLAGLDIGFPICSTNEGAISEKDEAVRGPATGYIEGFGHGRAGSRPGRHIDEDAILEQVPPVDAVGSYLQEQMRGIFGVGDDYALPEDVPRGSAGEEHLVVRCRSSGDGKDQLHTARTNSRFLTA